MSAGKAVLMIGAGGALLAVALDPSMFGGAEGVYNDLKALFAALKGVPSNTSSKGTLAPSTAQKISNVLKGKSPDDPSQSLGDWLATVGGDPVIAGLTHGGPLDVTQGGKSDMTPQCAAAWSACRARYSDQATINLCVSNYPPGDPCGLVNGQGGPFASYFGVHPSGAGSVVYHA